MSHILNKKFNFIVYTDGACLGNPGPGGWAAIIINEDNQIKKIYGSEKNTTNNRMELKASIKAINEIKNCKNIKIFTDSKYLIDGINNWIIKWKKNNWMTSNKKPVKNKDLWITLDNLLQNLSVEWEWVKGHSGNKMNEEVDLMARNEASKLNTS